MATPKPAKKKRRPLTIKERKDADLMAEAFEAAKAQGRKVTQRELASTFKVNETVISQMITKVTAINAEWKLRVAQYLDTLPQRIWPDWEFTNLTPGQIPPSAVRIAEAWLELDEKDRPAVEAVIERLKQKKTG